MCNFNTKELPLWKVSINFEDEESQEVVFWHSFGYEYFAKDNWESIYKEVESLSKKEMIKILNEENKDSSRLSVKDDGLIFEGEVYSLLISAFPFYMDNYYNSP